MDRTNLSKIAILSSTSQLIRFRLARWLGFNPKHPYPNLLGETHLMRLAKFNRKKALPIPMSPSSSSSMTVGWESLTDLEVVCFPMRWNWRVNGNPYKEK